MIYQLLTDRFALPPSSEQGAEQTDCNLSDYCGGTWSGIGEHLDYVRALGFDAIWVSPIVKNTANGYHGYWTEDFNRVNPHFGTAGELSALLARAHDAQLLVMLDVVANHVGPVGFDYTSIVPFNDSRYYHSCAHCPGGCVIEQYTCFSFEIEKCRTSGLPDLNQSEPFVDGFLRGWIAGVLRDFAFDGLRVDTVPEIAPNFWGGFQAATGGAYSVGEVFTGDLACIAEYNRALPGVLSYPLFFTLRSVFAQGQSMYAINGTLEGYQRAGIDRQMMANFLDNHDNPRFLSLNADVRLYRSALTCMLMMQGIPIVYYGSEQGFAGGADPRNREPLWPTRYNTSTPLFRFIAQVAAFRASIPEYNDRPMVQRYVDDSFYAYTMGDVFVATTNRLAARTERTIIDQPYADGTRLCNLFWPKADCITVEGGKFTVYLDHGESKIYSPNIHSK